MATAGRTSRWPPKLKQRVVLLGDGAGSFGAATNFGVGAGNGPFSVARGRFQRDARQDLATANVNSNNVSVLLGTARRAFLAATNFNLAVTRVGWQLVI